MPVCICPQADSWIMHRLCLRPGSVALPRARTTPMTNQSGHRAPAHGSNPEPGTALFASTDVAWTPCTTCGSSRNINITVSDANLWPRAQWSKCHFVLLKPFCNSIALNCRIKEFWCYNLLPRFIYLFIHYYYYYFDFVFNQIFLLRIGKCINDWNSSPINSVQWLCITMSNM